MNVSNVTGSKDFFEPAFRNVPLKLTIICATLAMVIFQILSGYGIIWYEKYGSDKKRILINRCVFKKHPGLFWFIVDVFSLQ